MANHNPHLSGEWKSSNEGFTLSVSSNWLLDGVRGRVPHIRELIKEFADWWLLSTVVWTFFKALDVRFPEGERSAGIGSPRGRQCWMSIVDVLRPQAMHSVRKRQVRTQKPRRT